MYFAGRDKSTKNPRVMTEQQKNILWHNWDKIIENVRSEDIVDYLIQVRFSTIFNFKLIYLFLSLQSSFSTR